MGSHQCVHRGGAPAFLMPPLARYSSLRVPMIRSTPKIHSSSLKKCENFLARFSLASRSLLAQKVSIVTRAVLQSPVQSLRGLFWDKSRWSRDLFLRLRDKSRFLPLYCSYSRSLQKLGKQSSSAAAAAVIGDLPEAV